MPSTDPAESVHPKALHEVEGVPASACILPRVQAWGSSNPKWPFTSEMLKFPVMCFSELPDLQASFSEDTILWWNLEPDSLSIPAPTAHTLEALLHF